MTGVRFHAAVNCAPTLYRRGISSRSVGITAHKQQAEARCIAQCSRSAASIVQAQIAPDRRSALVALVTGLASTSLLGSATAETTAEVTPLESAERAKPEQFNSKEALSPEQVKQSVLGNSSVVPALTVNQYLARLKSKWPLAKAEIKGYLDRSDYSGLSNSLVVSPFDDVRQSLFYIPWALLPTNSSAAIDCQVAYNDFLQKLKAFDHAATSAGSYGADSEEVQAAFDALALSLADYLRKVPQ